MKIFNLTVFIIILSSSLIGLCNAVEPKKPQGYILISGVASNEYFTLPGVSITLKSNTDSIPLYSNSDGKFSFKLEFQRMYWIIFSKEGYLSKQFEFKTETPESVREFIFQYEFTVTMTPDTGSNVPLLKTDAVIGYVDSLENFAHLPMKEMSKDK